MITRIRYACALLAMTLMVAGNAIAQSDDTFTITIAASQPLGEALQSFADQSGLQVIFFSEVTRGLEYVGLDGD